MAPIDDQMAQFSFGWRVDRLHNFSRPRKPKIISLESSVFSTKKIYLTLIRESWKKATKRGIITERILRFNPERSVASFVYVPLL